MVRLSRFIIRPYKEKVQGYLSISCNLGSQALTKGGVIIIKPNLCVYMYHNNTVFKNLDQLMF